ncbi:MAG: hypothetical protein AB7F22_30170 [Reyranella sp.]
MNWKEKSFLVIVVIAYSAAVTLIGYVEGYKHGIEFARSLRVEGGK